MIYNKLAASCRKITKKRYKTGMVRYRIREKERGVALLLALIFVTFFGGIIVVVVSSMSLRSHTAEADVAAWEMIQLSKAARLVVRDRMIADPNLRNAALAHPLLSIQDLKDSGYLQPNFGRPQVGGVDVNTLDQEIKIIVASWSPDGLGTTADDKNVPTAFVYFRPGGKSSGGLASVMAESARKYGVSLGAPLFDGGGNIISPDCRGGGPAVVIWDTGCMTSAEFTDLTGDAFAAGALVMPVWKSSRQDTRTVMRFPQPDNPGYSTMLTDLEMGTPTVADCPDTADQVSITAADGTVTSTGLCKVVDDNPADLIDGDKRFNVENVSSMSANRIIAEPQPGGDFGGSDPTVAPNMGPNDEAFTVVPDATGTTGNVTLMNDLQVYRTRALPALVTERFAVPNASLAVERNTRVYSQSADATKRGITTIGTAAARTLVAQTLSAGTLQSTEAGTNGAPRLNVNGAASFTGDASSGAEWLTQTLNSTGATTATGDDVKITNTLGLGGTTLNVSGDATIKNNIREAATVTVNNSIAIANTLTAASTRNANGTGPLPTLNVTGSCRDGNSVIGGCPNRQMTPPNITP